ncbi:DUF4388 domain-containing protein [Hyalangium versicolor]|uniref:DUF4388 domain-containing protein n=1 Tax=Hyalangium versicolor TaxID=2861190 RepID=UPI001CCA369B|nr:DUF4388 domain-containing protein [Hyalangium versicolor]
MKTILLVNDNHCVHATAICAFAPYPEFRLLTASSYLEALWTLCDVEVDLVIVHTGLPDRAGLELLTYLANYRPKVAVLTTSRVRKTEKLETLVWRGHLSRPLTPHALVSRVKDCLRSQASEEYRSLALHDLLRILCHERETCVLRMKQGLRSGTFQFQQGQILQVACEDTFGAAAAHHMMSWESPWFRVEPLPEPSASRPHCKDERILA